MYSLCCELQVSSVYDYTSNLNMDFDALMSKKLGGKYLKPSHVEKKVQENVESAKDGEDEIILTPPPKEIPTKTQNLGHNKKCQSCKFTATSSAALKMHSQADHGGGLLSNSAGFMITNDAPNGVSNEDMAENEESFPEALSFVILKQLSS